MAEREPYQGDWLEYNKGVFGRMMTMFKWVVIVAMIILAALWAFAA